MFEVKVPELAESIHEGTISEWLKDKGEFVEEGEAIVELETDKINVEINSDKSGVLKEVLFQAGDIVQVGDIIAKIDENESVESVQLEDDKEDEVTVEEQSVATSSDVQKKDSPENNVTKDENHKPIASPAARKKARELGIDINEVAQSDPTGRIRTEDVLSESKSSSQNENRTASKTLTEDKPVERIKMSRRRQTIAARLVEAQHTAAMLTTFNEVDMSAVMDVRKRRKDAFQQKHDVKLGFMSFFTKAVVGALKEFPNLNAEIQGDEILLKKYYDIGIAVSAKEGLVVPIVRDADRLSFAQIEKNIADLATKAKENKLGLNDLQGGSFTITNGGIFGSLYSTPILNTPQVGILGMHTIQRRPIVVDDKDTVEVRPMMYIALSYDHRIVDGSEAVSFLVRIKQLLEDPEDLLLEG